MKITHIGPISYTGGVSVHIDRLVKLLGHDIEFSVIDDSPLSISKIENNIRSFKCLFSITRIVRSSDLVHVHCGHWLLRIFVIFLTYLLRKKTVVSLHSFRLKGFKKQASRACLLLAHQIICVNKQIASNIGIKNKCIVKEAFLPPYNYENDTLPIEVLDYIKVAEGRFLLCANAYKLVQFEGRDLYGLDQCIEVAKLAKKHNLKISIIFVIGTMDKNDSLFKFYENEIKNHSLGEIIKIYPNSLSFVNLIQRCDIVLRPTLSDGDALTVREALFFKKPVIASDVVNRPKGSILYKSNNVPDLFQEIENALQKLNSESPIMDESESSSYSKFYLRIYKACIN